MYICMYVCMYIHIYICMYIYIYTHMYLVYTMPFDISFKQTILNNRYLPSFDLTLFFICICFTSFNLNKQFYVYSI